MKSFGDSVVLTMRKADQKGSDERRAKSDERRRTHVRWREIGRAQRQIVWKPVARPSTRSGRAVNRFNYNDTLSLVV